METRMKAAVSGPWLLLLALAAGCGGKGGESEDGDASEGPEADAFDAGDDADLHDAMPEVDAPDAGDDDPGDVAGDPDAEDGEEEGIEFPAGPLFGWGGYIVDTAQADAILDDLDAGGYTAVRYWGRPAWCYGAGSHGCDTRVLDHIVEQAALRGMIVYVDCEHNYPPSEYIQGEDCTEEAPAGYVDAWIADLVALGRRYMDSPNVVLECVNEYTGGDQVELFNQAIGALRDNGIHLPLLFNFWWNQRNVALDDPDENYAVGRHLYGTACGGYNPPTPTALPDAVSDPLSCGDHSVADSMARYFDDPAQTMYLQSVLDLGIPNGWVITELGPTDDESMVGDPSVGNMAYAMQFLREAAAHEVSVICYRVGEQSRKEVYEARALEYFGEQYFTPP